MAEMRDVAILGRDYPKVDALDKALGRAKFAADYYMPNMLYGGVYRSTVPHAVIKKLNMDKARALPGVACVLDYTAIPGKNRFGIIVKDEPCLVDDKVRRYGDAICVIAAETPEIVEEAKQLIEVEYEELPVINSFESALAEGAVCVHGTTNVHAKKHLEFGNVDEAWDKCDIIIENTYSTHVLSHMFIEPDAGIAYYDEKGIMTVIASTQNAHYDRNEVAAMLGVPQNKVRCIQPTTGGGFGGKLDIGVQLHIALMAHYTKRPVKMVRSRTESTMVSSKRHPITTRVKTGATKDGKLVAAQYWLTCDAGAYGSYGPAVIGRFPVHCVGPYECPNVRLDATFVYTNNPMCGAFRGFGVPQSSVPAEGQMDAIAKALHMNPLEIRRINGHHVGSVIPTGQELTESVGYLDTLTAAIEKAKEVMPDALERLDPDWRG
jgi:CO/xanthine dehydrogenase Mo-binding subunit